MPHPANLPVRDTDPVGLARRLVADNCDPPGCVCPACGRVVCARTRQLSGVLAWGLALLYCHLRDHPREDWAHAERLFARHPDGSTSLRGDFAKLRFWGLLELRDAPGAAGGTGYCRPTDRGRSFVLGRHLACKWIVLLGNRVVARSDRRVGVAEVLGRRAAAYARLLGGPP